MYKGKTKDRSQTRIKEEKCLGMSAGKAAHILKKSLFLKLLQQTNNDICFRCKTKIQTAAELSIDHKIDWRYDKVDLYWNLDNIAYSHRKCNKPSRFKAPSGKRGIVTTYQFGCRCRLCKDAKNHSNNKWRWKIGLRKQRIK